MAVIHVDMNSLRQSEYESDLTIEVTIQDNLPAGSYFYHPTDKSWSTQPPSNDDIRLALDYCVTKLEAQYKEQIASGLYIERFIAGILKEQDKARLTELLNGLDSLHLMNETNVQTGEFYKGYNPVR